MLNKADLRRSLLQQRRQLPLEDWRGKSDRLCAHLQSTPIFQQAHTILAYFSIRQEPDLTPLFALPKRWGFPRCEGELLTWHQWCISDSLPRQFGRFNIPEPHPDAPLIPVADVDLVLVPAVACDHQGYRLGYGAGFYDRLFSHPRWKHKPAIGIGFDFARLPALPIDPWDQQLSAICTEVGVFWHSQVISDKEMNRDGRV